MCPIVIFTVHSTLFKKSSVVFAMETEVFCSEEVKATVWGRLLPTIALLFEFIQRRRGRNNMD